MSYDFFDNYEFEKRKPGLEILYDLFRKHVKDGGKVLDVGCAYGFFLKLCEDNYKCYGIDYDRKAIEAAKKFTKAKLRIRNANKKLPFKDDFFDAIVMFDVLEHLKNYRSALKECKRVLKKDGWLFIIVPNRKSILHLLLGKRWSFYKDKTHLNLFSGKELKRIVNESGLDTESLKTMLNFSNAGESTPSLAFLRNLKILFIPFYGDSLFLVARAK